MKSQGFDAYVVPSEDPHLSEYAPDCFRRREFLTGFDGSAGVALLSPSEARLWTDGRYWEQASMQLKSPWKLMKQGEAKVQTLCEFLKEKAKKGEVSTVGIDPLVHPASFVKELKGSLDGTGCSVSFSESSLVDAVWGDGRPALPLSSFRVHPLKYAGAKAEDKVKAVREKLKKEGCGVAVFGMLDEVAYLYNLRGDDVPCCPVGFGYALVTPSSAVLYTNESKVSDDEVKKHLKKSGVKVLPYDQIFEDMKDFVASGKKVSASYGSPLPIPYTSAPKPSPHPPTPHPRTQVWLDKSKVNCALSSLVTDELLVSKQNAVEVMKAVKNPTELDGMVEAHILDGVAMAKFMAWLKREQESGRPVSETTIDARLIDYRGESEHFIGPSFPTIAGVGSNGAIIHYRAQEGSSLLKSLSPDTPEPLLIDSGGQYSMGTTDVTRTWQFGPPTDFFKAQYTRVLKGNINLDCTVFPEGTPGVMIDCLARRHLWDDGYDYGHGTGHGVGAALNVHEGPASISPRIANKEVRVKLVVRVVVRDTISCVMQLMMQVDNAISRANS